MLLKDYYKRHYTFLPFKIPCIISNLLFEA